MTPTTTTGSSSPSTRTTRPCRIDRNIGKVTIQGVDLEAGFRPTEHLTLYGSASFVKSEMKDDIVVVVSGMAVVLPTKGKELVLTPERDLRAPCAVRHRQCSRSVCRASTSASASSSDMNDRPHPGLSPRWTSTPRTSCLTSWARTTDLRVNVDNLFDRTLRQPLDHGEHGPPDDGDAGGGGTATFARARRSHGRRAADGLSSPCAPSSSAQAAFLKRGGRPGDGPPFSVWPCLTCSACARPSARVPEV